MSVANGITWHKQDPTVRAPARVEIKEWHRCAMAKALKSRAGWARRCTWLNGWEEEDVEAIRAFAESLGWETSEENDPEGVTLVFEKGKQCKLLLLPSR